MKSIFIMFCSFVFLLISCEDSSPQLGTVKHMILYDYTENDEQPKERLAVYVELQSDPGRINTFSIRSQETDYVWQINDLFYINDKRKNMVWIGSANFQTSSQYTLPRGNYVLTYTDLAERSEQLYFTINETPENVLDENIPNNMALYDENESLIHVGKNESIESILPLYPNARFMREITVLGNGNSAILNPMRTINDGE